MESLGLKRQRWFFYTFLFGLIPYVVRLFSSLVRMATDNLTEYPWAYLIAPADWVAFGLVLNVTILNETLDTNHLPQATKERNFGLALVFLVIFAGLYMATLILEGKSTPQTKLVNRALFFAAIFLSAISSYIGYGVYKLEKKK